MAGTTEDAETAAERLEAALERIAKAARESGALTDIRERLDRVIERLRAALKD